MNTINIGFYGSYRHLLSYLCGNFHTMTTYIAFDTNIWIYLATKSNYNSLLDEVIKQYNDGEILLLINEIIKKEWYRNREGTLNSCVESIKGELKNAKRIASFLPQPENETFCKILDTYKDEEKRIAIVEERLNRIEEVMEKYCINIPITQEQILHIANLAIEAKHPFHNKKNQFNDALIVRSLCQFVSTQIYKSGKAMHKKYDFIFVSNNQQDFIEPQTQEIYPSITEGIDINYSIANVAELGQALNMSQELIDDWDEMIEAWLDYEAQRQLDIMRGK